MTFRSLFLIMFLKGFVYTIVKSWLPGKGLMGKRILDLFSSIAFADDKRIVTQMVGYALDWVENVGRKC